MKLYKICIFITIVFIGFCAFNIVDAIRIDFLNKSTGLQPPPLDVNSNISRNINLQINQNQSGSSIGSNSLSTGATLNSERSNLNGNKSASHTYNFLWFIIFPIIVILIAVLFFYAIKKKKISG